MVRFSFVDQHGILRGKTMVAAEAAVTMRNGCTATSTLLAKDTAHRTVFPVFTPGGGFGMPEMEGAADMLLVADPSTFRILPWAHKTGWLLCDLYFPNGKPVTFSTRRLLHDQLERLAKRGSPTWRASKSSSTCSGWRTRGSRRRTRHGRRNHPRSA